MKDKEKLLSMEEPLQFIFSHSALREGWDNPNVFQICTLNETKSDLKKRQEIGRGLRLPVDNEGQRVQDKSINVLTVIANENYMDFTKALQSEIQEDTSVSFTGRLRDARDKDTIRLTKELTEDNFPLLFEIWEKISQKTRYSVEYSTEVLIKRATEAVSRMPITQRPLIESQVVRLDITEKGVEGKLQESEIHYADRTQYQIPDVYAYIQNKINITRTTIYTILMQSNRYEELAINPQVFLDNVINCIRGVLTELLVEGVKYEAINNNYYEMTLFKLEEIETYLSNLFPVTNTDKTIFNYVPIDSEIEASFARDCEADTAVKFYFKLPKKFKIPTPLGNYNPDWGIVFEHDSRVYFVAETKGTLERQALRTFERMKIECGEKHFALFEPVKYRLVVDRRDLY